MWLPERTAPARLALLIGGLALGVAGCTVRPLYSTAAISPGGETTGATLSSISVNPVATRYAQEVRNELIFALQGGNIGLQPEKAVTVSGGVVLTPSVVPGLTLSADWYSINIHGAIDTAATVVPVCVRDPRARGCLTPTWSSRSRATVGDPRARAASRRRAATTRR